MGSDVNGKVTEGGHRASTSDEQLIGRLAELWQGHHRKDLEIRHRTGVLLNERLGPPTKRQAYGPGILKRVGEECRISQSEISRMRSFALRFDTLERFQKEHPGVSSWTKVKGLLPGLEPRKGGETAILSRTATGGVTRSLTGLITKLRGMDPIPKGRPGKALRGQLQELIKVAKSCLANQTPSPALETDSSPGRPVRANADGR